MSKTIGVGFLLFSVIEGVEKLFFIEELYDKPAICKEKGMFSFPLETMEPEDQSLEDTIRRLLVEEVGILPGEAEILGISSKEFSLIPGKEDISTRYGYGVLLDDPYRDLYPRDDKIRFAGWLSLTDIFSQSRPYRVEVMPILIDFYQTHQEQVSRRLRTVAYG